MAATLSLEGVTVERDGEPVDGGPQVGAVVRYNVLRVTKRGQLLLELDGVTAVRRIDARNWAVDTASGTVHVTKVRNCGCGR